MIYQLESARRFPCRVRIGARAVGWVESEVQLWLADRIERYRAPTTQQQNVWQQYPPLLVADAYQVARD
jgi:hypothetical protein